MEQNHDCSRSCQHFESYEKLQGFGLKVGLLPVSVTSRDQGSVQHGTPRRNVDAVDKNLGKKDFVELKRRLL